MFYIICSVALIIAILMIVVGLTLGEPDPMQTLINKTIKNPPVVITAVVSIIALIALLTYEPAPDRSTDNEYQQQAYQKCLEITSADYCWKRLGTFK